MCHSLPVTTEVLRGELLLSVLGKLVKVDECSKYNDPFLFILVLVQIFERLENLSFRHNLDPKVEGI